ncbi:MAG: aldo/keto reductase [Clostridia bacterium]|nr:aldo/keto reductase [Clostridia bacterium]
MIFDKIKKNFGFGVMRLKMNENEVDYDEFNKMIDIFMDAGYNYFDTAHGYIDGKSEVAIHDCLVSRYDREDYFLANKLSPWFFEKEEDILPMFESQLKICGVDYFDAYFFHTVHRNNYPKYKDANAFEIIGKLKEQGKIKHIFMSFHDTADFLDEVLNEQGDLIEAVQLMFNYLDYDDPNTQSRACYDVAVKHGKKVIVMEPVRGGALANLSPKALDTLKEAGDVTPASFALRFGASHSEVIMVLSGMGTVDMVKENIKTMSDFVPFTQKEYDIAKKIRGIIRDEKQVPCTNCRYCTDVCPENIPIPGIFKAYNGYLSASVSKNEAKTNLPDDKKASDCIKCGKCEEVCPQKIKIREHLEKVSETFK